MLKTHSLMKAERSGYIARFEPKIGPLYIEIYAITITKVLK